MSGDLSSVGERIVVFCAFAVATVFIVASLIGYDFLGDRNVIDPPTRVYAPVWSELVFGVAALSYGVYVLRRLRKNAQ